MEGTKWHRRARKPRKTAPGGQHFGPPQAALQIYHVNKTLQVFEERVKYTSEWLWTTAFVIVTNLKCRLYPNADNEMM